MRWIFGVLLATGLMIPPMRARAQDAMNAFGGYPAGITTGSTYGFYPGGYV
jgi:hypothetical protein